MDVETGIDDGAADDLGAFSGNPVPRLRRQDRLRLDRLRRPKRSENELRADLGLAPTTVEVSASGFNPTFQGKRYERTWIMTGLGPFHDNNLITDVIRSVKGGKEANVYCCAAHPALGVAYLAGKVYRPRMFRQLRNDKVYRDGRIILDADGKRVKDEGAAHAVAMGTSFGKDLLHTSWLAHEYRALTDLHSAGALVPRPYGSAPNAILMEYLGDAETPAPILNDVDLERDEANELFDELIGSVTLMLRSNRVHGDLSAYNVLYWEGDVRIIDFPQVVDIDSNPQAYRIFRRDVERLGQYFQSCGVKLDSRRLADDLWRKNVGRVTDAERRIEDQRLHLDNS